MLIYEFEKLMKLKNTEIRKYYTPSNLVASMGKSQVLKFMKSHGGILYISHVCDKFQFTTAELRNVIIKDNMFTRHGKILTSSITVREGAARAVVRTQKSLDVNIYHEFVQMFADEKNTTLLQFYKYTKKLESKGKIANPNFTLESFGRRYPADALLLELKSDDII